MIVGARQYSAVVIGCGKIGSRFSTDSKNTSPHSRSHAEAYVKNKRTQLAGLSDADSCALHLAASHWKVGRTSVDPIELCRELEPDIVSICSPDASHAGLLSSLLMLPVPPKGILIEKPLALSRAEAVSLSDQLSGKDTRVVVNYSRRFSPFFRDLEIALRKGLLGTPIGAQAIYGKGLFHNGCHLVNLLRFWFGEPSELIATGAKWGPDEDPSISFIYKCRNGMEIQTLAIDERAVTAFEMSVLTDKYRFQYSLGGSQWHFHGVGDGPVLGYKNYLAQTGFPVSGSEDPLRECLDAAVEHMVGLVADPSSVNWSPIEDAVQDLKVLEQISQLGKAREP